MAEKRSRQLGSAQMWQQFAEPKTKRKKVGIINKRFQFLLSIVVKTVFA